MDKIKIKFQIDDIKIDVPCYVIYAETSYNLLLGKPWIHRNGIVPSTLHQIMKYVDERDLVRTLMADCHLFKGIKIYYTNFLLYKD